MIIEELKNKIRQHQFNDAFEILSEVFGDMNPQFNRLQDRHIDPPENYSRSTFSEKLESFVIKSKKDIQVYYQGVAVDNGKQDSGMLPHDKIYKLLCHLNFEHQFTYFNSIINSSKTVIPFIIRARENYGQRWLYNRLITQYQMTNPVHQSVTIDLAETKCSFENLVNYLIEHLGESTLDKSLTLRKKRISLKNIISAKVSSATQFIILKNAYTLIHSSEFDSLRSALEYIYEEIDVLELDYKCILLFVENDAKSYACQDYCIDSRKIKAAQAKFIGELKFIDLCEHEPIQKKDIIKWFDHLDEESSTCFKNYILDNTKVDDLLKECCDGNPEKVLEFICKKIGKNFEEHQNLWLKH